MGKIRKREQILTVPNLFSLMRLLMIPWIIWLYRKEQNDLMAAAVLALSGITDILDGFIARRFGMVSDLGKLLDPVADKLTQGAVIICLAFRYPLMWGLICFFVIKELCMGVIGLYAIHRQKRVNSSKWYGKLNTAILYVTMALLILFPDISKALSIGLIILCGGTMLLSFVLYLRFYIDLFRKNKVEE